MTFSPSSLRRSPTPAAGRNYPVKWATWTPSNRKWCRPIKSLPSFLARQVSRSEAWSAAWFRKWKQKRAGKGAKKNPKNQIRNPKEFLFGFRIWFFGFRVFPQLFFKGDADQVADGLGDHTGFAVAGHGL